jgi:hypothetical protein
MRKLNPALEYPRPIAFFYDKLQDALSRKDSPGATRNLVALVESSLRFLASVSLSVYLDDSRSDPRTDHQILQRVTGRCNAAGKYYGIIDCSLKAADAQTYLLPELLETWLDLRSSTCPRPSTLAKDWGKLIQFRNQIHKGPPPPARERDLLQSWTPFVEELLQRYAFLADWNLLAADNAESRVDGTTVADSFVLLRGCACTRAREIAPVLLPDWAKPPVLLLSVDSGRSRSRTVFLYGVRMWLRDGQPAGSVTRGARLRDAARM